MAQGDFPEGATATHKDGRKIVFRDGEWRVAQGASGSGGASGAKPAGVEQSNAASFLRRALGAAAAYQQQGLGPRSVTGKAFNANFPDLANTVPEFLGGNSESQQVADTSKLEFIAATLRKDSGANLPESEIATQDRIYFPQPGEGPKVIEAKARARERVIRGLIDSAGSAVTEDLKKTYPNFFPKAQTEGGDQTSGTAGAVGAAATPPAGPTATPPAPGTPPQGGGDIGFNVAKPANEKRLTADEEAQFAAFLPTATPDSIVKWIGDRGLVITPEAAQNAIDAFKKTGVAPQFGYVKPEVDITDVRGEGGVAEGARAFVRGIPAVVGLDDELNAVLDGGDYEKALQKERAVSAYDEQNNFLPRLGGQLLAGAVIPSGATGAARAAGIAAIRGGATKEAAQAVAARVFATRTAQEAAGLGGAYGAGDAEGGIVDRAAGAVTGAAVGAVAGGATGYAGSRIAQALRARAAAKGAATAERSVAEIGQDYGIPATPATNGGFAARAVQMGLGNLPGGMTAVSKAVDGETEGLRNAARGIAEEIGTVSTRQEAGAGLARGARAYERLTSRQGGALYRQRDNLMGGASVAVPLAETRSQFAQFSQAFPTSPALAALREHPAIRALENALPEDGPVTLGEATEALSHIRGVVRNLTKSNSATPAITRRVGQLEQAIEDDVMTAAQQADLAAGRGAGPGSAAQAQKDADAFWRTRSATLQGALKKPLKSYRDDTDVGGEAVYNGVVGDMQRKGGNLARLRQTWFNLPSNARSTFAATHIDDMGRALAGQQNDLGTEWSFNTFLTNYDNLAPQARNVVFGKEATDQIADIAKYSARLRTLDKARNFSNTAKNTISGALLATMGTALWHGNVGAAAEVAAAVPAAYLSGKLFLANPAMRAWTKDALTVVGRAAMKSKPDETKSAALVKRLTRIARAEPAIANEVLDLQRRLAEAFTVSPTRLAASEGPDRNAPVEGNTGDPQANQQGLQP